MPRFSSLAPLCKQLLKNNNQASKWTTRCLADLPPRAMYGGRHTVTMMPGDGIGPEMMIHVEEVFRTARVPVEFEKIRFNKDFNSDADLATAVLSIKRNGVCLKGSLEKSRSKYITSINAKLRAELQLDTNLVHCKTVKNVPARHDLDIVIIRQNTEGEYSMLEHSVADGVVENSKVITRKKSTELAHYAFLYALRNNRKTVTCVHKANIMKLSDGLFLRTLEKVSEEYLSRGIVFNEMIVDNTCMQLAMKPSQFDVMVTPNLYGLVIQNLVSGLAGGAGLFSGRNLSKTYAVFEPGTRNTGSDLPSNVGNPVAMLSASVDLLKHLQLTHHADIISKSIKKTLEEDRIHTQDLGGSNSTQEVVQNIIKHVKTAMQIDS